MLLCSSVTTNPLFLFPFQSPLPLPSISFALLSISDIFPTFNKNFCPFYFLPLLNMAGQSIVKRPVVFTWAYLQKYPTLEARYAETLPFCDRQLHPCDDSGDVWYCPFTYSNCECKCDSCVQRMKRLARCIKRTGERWAVSILSELYLWAPNSHVLVMFHYSNSCATKHS